MASPAAVAAPVQQVTDFESRASLPGPRYAWISMPSRLAVEIDFRVQDIQLRARIKATIDKACMTRDIA